MGSLLFQQLACGPFVNGMMGVSFSFPNTGHSANARGQREKVTVADDNAGEMGRQYQYARSLQDVYIRVHK